MPANSRAKEELTGPGGLPRIPKEGEFSKAWDVIGALQQMTSTKTPSFTKEVAKTPEPVTSGKTIEAPK